MNIGAAGATMIFLMLLVGTVIIALYVVAYTAHIILVVIDSTATGFDEVAWPDEPYFDWVWKGIYLVWLTLIWLVPLLFLGRHLAKTQSTDAAITTFLYAAVGLFWLVFPISLLSSMSATSRWIIFSPSLVPRLFERFDVLIGFYLVTGPLFALMAAGVFTLVKYGNVLWTPLGAVILGAGILIYGRLFGRLAFQMRFTKDRAPRAQAAARRSTRARGRARAPAHDPWGPLGDITQPSEMAPTDAPDPDARTGYDVRLDDGPGPAPDAHVRRLVDEEPEPYVIADGPAHINPPRGPMPDRVIKPSDYEMELARKGKAPKPSEHPWMEGTFSFPFWEANRSVLVCLTLGLGIFGLMFRLMLSNSIT